jgi:hypothetical protein
MPRRKRMYIAILNQIVQRGEKGGGSGDRRSAAQILRQTNNEFAHELHGLAARKSSGRLGVTFIRNL